MAESEPTIPSPEEQEKQHIAQQIREIFAMMKREADPVVKRGLAEFLIGLQGVFPQEIPDTLGEAIEEARRGYPDPDSNEQFIEDVRALHDRMERAQEPYIKTALAARLMALEGDFLAPDPEDTIGLTLHEVRMKRLEAAEEGVNERNLLAFLTFLALIGALKPEEAESQGKLGGISMGSFGPAILALLLLGSISAGDWMKKYGKQQWNKMHIPRVSF